ncbi:MAG: AbrB/MazE/SpoVT family DNA-binding domain-containing protein [Dehalococcoidales bacterium]|nr:AbrB/MazE/SpoVT family DNA-binding domain-containing protein [Dehalococcoidales bacterium]
MESKIMGEREHKFYGSTTVGERGQVVIPAEARRDMNISPATKLLVFGGHGGQDLVFIRSESMAEFLTRAKGMMSQLEEIVTKEKNDKIQ